MRCPTTSATRPPCSSAKRSNFRPTLCAAASLARCQRSTDCPSRAREELCASPTPTEFACPGVGSLRFRCGESLAASRPDPARAVGRARAVDARIYRANAPTALVPCPAGQSPRPSQNPGAPALPALCHFSIAFSTRPACSKWCASTSGWLSATSGNCSSSTCAIWRGAAALAPEQALVGRVLDQGVLEAVGRFRRRAAAEDQLGRRPAGRARVAAPPLDGRRPQRAIAWENSRPIAAPICATSLTGASDPAGRSSESRRSRGWRAAAAGPKARSDRPSSLSRPDSSTVLVSSSTNSGTPSVFATICASTSSGSALPPTTRSTIAAPSRRPSRFRASVSMCGWPDQGGRTPAGR